MPANTAILFFTRTPREEAQVKTLHPANKVANQDIVRALIGHTEQVAIASELPLITLHSDLQEGRSFGERLANALEYVFSQGYHRVIALGNDCPTLQVEHIKEAAHQLDRHPLVVGPSLDGGIYLLGITRASYQRESLMEIPWQSTRVLEYLQAYAYQLTAQEAPQLDHQPDIDSFCDLKQHLAQIRKSCKGLYRLITYFLNFSQPQIRFSARIGFLFLLRNLPLRAPPH